MSTAAQPDQPLILNRSTEALFRPFEFKGLTLPNRIVMAPMTRSLSPEGVPGANVAAYYRRRAEGGVALIVTEGTLVDHPAAGFNPSVPNFHGEQSLTGWRRVAEQVHAAGGRIFPQLWHVGMVIGGAGSELKPGVEPIGPGNMSQRDIDAVIDAFAKGAESAKDLGFDGVELHGAHGYLIDQFFWSATNERADRYGGDLVSRTRFAAEIIQRSAAARRSGFSGGPALLAVEIAGLRGEAGANARGIGSILRPLVDAGVDAFHCSTRRFWEPEFPESDLGMSDLNLAGWTKKLTGKPSITVGSVTLNEDMMTSFAATVSAGVAGIDNLLDRLDRDEFDLVAIGRSLIVNPAWPGIIRKGALSELLPFNRSVLGELV